MRKKRFVIITGFLSVFVFLSLGVHAQEDYQDIIQKALDSFESTLKEMPSPKEAASSGPEGGPDRPAPVPSTPMPEVAPDLTQAEDTNQKVVPMPAPSVDTVEAEQKEISIADKTIMIDVLELKDMEIKDVLKLISKKTGLNIVAGRNVKGTVTIYLKDIEAMEALRIILESHEMAFTEEGGILKVMMAKDYESAYGRKFGDKTKIKIVQLKATQASQALSFVNEIKSSIGKVIADDKSNTLILIDIPENIEQMIRLINEIDVKIETEVFVLSYAKAEEISEKIREALTPNVGSMKFDQRSNKVVVADTPQRIEEIKKMIEAFDEKLREVLIEARILQIVLSDQFKMGVDWEAIVSNFHRLNLKSDFDVLSSAEKRGQVSIGTLSADDYTVLIEALDTVGTTNTLSNPRITALNNEEARILVGSTQPYVTTTTTTPAAGATTTAESVNFIEVGVKLYVTPTIHRDDFITMKIRPEVSSVTEFLTTSNNNTIPIVDTSEAETTVLVKDGVTIVIGGLIKDETIESVKKVPLLGDIPFLGAVFRNRDHLIRKTELVIFLTPHIISGDVTEEVRTNFISVDDKIR